MRAKDLAPDCILCSDATRTLETLECIARSLPDDPPRTFDKKLYLAESATLLQSLRKLDDTYQRILLVGHNPGCQDLARSLVKDRNAELAITMRHKFPTAGLAVLDFDINQWSDLQAGTGYLADLAFPSDMPEPPS